MRERALEPADPVRCENCESPLTGAYCAACGQSRRSPIGSVSAFLAHALEEVASLDSRLLRTLHALFLRPGRLTRDYLDGRRARYTQPVQLYLIAAAVFFLMASYRPFISIDTARREVIAQLPGISIGNEVGRERLLAAAANPLALDLFAERFAAAVQGVLPAFLIGSVLLFSLALYAVNGRRDSRFLAHAIFALHWTSFYLLMLAVARLFPAAWMVPNLMQLPLLAYLTVALRRVYPQGMILSFGKALLLSVIFILVLGVWVQSAIVIGMRAV